MNNQYDVVVIGAGVGGLVTGALLAKAGMSVCVVEKEKRPGGYLMGFERKGFTFDTSTHWLNECGPGGSVRTILEILGDDAPQTPPLTEIKRYKSASMDYLLTNTPDVLREQLCADFPKDKDGIVRFFADSRALNDEVWQLFRAERRSMATKSLYQKMRTGMRMARPGLRMRKLATTPVEEQLAHYFSADVSNTIYRSDQTIMSCMFPAVWAYEGDYQRPPDGGGKQIPLWLVKKLQEYGGTLHLGTPVTGLSMAGPLVTGVTLQDRDKSTREIRCDHVVAACDAVSLLKTLLPKGAVPQKRISQFENADVYASIFAINLGLDTDTTSLGLNGALCYVTEDGLGRNDHADADPAKAAISVLSPSARDASMAPAGKGTLSVQTSVPITYAHNWHTGQGYDRNDAYKAFKKEYADKLLDRVERDLIPGLRDHIEVFDIATPVTHMRYTDNHLGTIMATKPTGNNFRNHVGGHKTPVKNLFMAGHWAQCGGGVPLSVKAATTAVLMLLKKTKPEMFKEYCRQIDAHPV